MAELFRHPHVHLVVGQPQRDLGDLRREFLVLDAVELIDIHEHDRPDIEEPGFAVLVHLAQQVQFDQAQFLIGDHEEVAAAAGRIENPDAGQLGVKLKQPLGVALGAGLQLSQFGPQAVEEQRPKRLADVVLHWCSGRRGHAGPWRP